MNKFIVVEGPDGAGKTTTLDLLSTELGFPVVKTPSGLFKDYRSIFDEPDVDVRDRFEFYAHGINASMPEIYSAIEKYAGVLVDRYTQSLLYYHKSLDPRTDYESMVNRFGFPSPDLTLILHADIDILQSRISERTPGSDAHLENNSDLLETVLRTYRNSSEGILIDTGKHDQNQVLSYCGGLILN